MKTTRPFPMRPLALLLALSAVTPTQVFAWIPSGVQTVTAHTQDKQAIVIGTVDFRPQADSTSIFVFTMNHANFTDYFLSMKEFKCLGSPVEVTCHVPYPYQHPRKVSFIGLSRYPSNRRIPILSLSTVKKFSGTSENAVKTQIWCAIATYVLIAIVKKELQLKSSLYICARQIGSQNNPGLLKLRKTALSLALARVEC